MTLANRPQRLDLFRRCRLIIALVLFHSPAGNSQGLPLLPDSAGQSTISVKAELVVVPVRVTDAHGDFISGLRLHNFRVYEDGRMQEVTLFQQEDTPVTVGLVVDHSRSMGSKLPEVSAAISAFAKSSNPQDEMFVVDFNDSVSLELPGGKPFTNDAKELAEAISAVSARGQTALYDAMVGGLDHLQLGHWDKKALIIVSDGGDTASQHTYSDVLALARRSQAVIYSIGLVNASSADANPGVLRRLCKDTGGIAFFPEARESVANISAQIARDLREQYTLGFVPDKGNTNKSFRKIQVRVSVPGRGRIRVRTRPGYFGAEEKRPPAHSGKSGS